MRELHLDAIYPITVSGPVTGLGHLKLVEKYLEAGVRLFQVRDKLLDDRSFYEQLLQINQLCSEVGGRLIVNDRVDLALASGAAGVHLGQTDLPVQIARRILGETAVIGISTHNSKEFLEAQNTPVDYVAIGPVFETSTKKSCNKPLGVDLLREIATQKKLPLVAIGGITLENVAEVWKAGADSVAVISDIADAGDPARRIQEYLDRRLEC
jgi:thiamine-phosphate pyrophosphorylase